MLRVLKWVGIGFAGSQLTNVILSATVNGQ